MRTAEFCPKCDYPLEPSEDEGRLCGVCRWFGDQSEICAEPPTPDDLELAFLQLLVLYRNVCRMELLAEQLVEGQPVEGQKNYKPSLRAIQARTNHARHSILYLFRAAKGKKADNEETPT